MTGKRKILLAEDDAASLKLLGATLAGWGYAVQAVTDGDQAWAALQGPDAPRLALVDRVMPGLDGLELCRRIRERSQPYVYVVLLTRKASSRDVVAGLQAGADDYLAKPFEDGELRARLEAAQRLLAHHAELAGSIDELKDAATRDGLTGLWNRRAILELLRGELSRAQREQRPMALALVDIDSFKSLKDGFGHAAGDQALKDAASRIAGALRPYDAVGRYGGEEFLVLLPACDAAAGSRVMERVCSAVRAPRVGGLPPERITCSAGVAGTEGHGYEAAALLAASDRALYRAKAGGRDRVEVASAPPLRGDVPPPAPTVATAGGGILVVEDNPITRKMVRYALQAEGFEVREADDGHAALALAAAARPALVLQDLVLPDMDGVHLLEGLRALPSCAEVPVVVLSGLAGRLEELRAVAGGFDDFLLKPVEPSRLVQVVRSHLQGERRARETPDRVRRILFADDDPLNRKLTEVRLHLAGLEVTSVASGREALAEALRNPPDAVLSDVLMPGMDGFQLCLALRREPRLAGIPVVLISSSYVEKEDRLLARRMGAADLVLRTPDLAAPIEAVRMALESEPAPPPAGSVEVDDAYRDRLLWQLERQLGINTALAQRGALQASALSLVTSMAQLLSHPREIPAMLGDVLVHCLDAAGLSTGVLYLREPDGGLRLHCQCGLSAAGRAQAAAAFGHLDLLQTLQEGLKPAALSRTSDPRPEVHDFLGRAGIGSALVVPLTVADRAYGVLVLASSTADLVDDSWTTFGRALSSQFGQAVALGESVQRLAESEARYRALMEQANDAIFVLSPDGVILEANRRCEALLGLASDRLVGRHIVEFSPQPGDATPENVRRFQQVLAAGGGPDESIVLRRADGARVEVDFSMSLHQVGGVACVLSIGRDVTERNRAAAALRKAQDRLEHVVASSPAVLYSLRPSDGRYVGRWVSPNVERLVGYTPEEILRPDWWPTHLHEDDRERVLSELGSLATHGQLSHEYRFRTRSGDYRWLRAEMRLLRDAEGNPVEAIGSWSDVTQRRETEEAAREGARQATFTGEVSAALVLDEPIGSVLRRCCESAVRHLGAAFARIWTLVEADQVLELQASAGMYTRLDGAHGRVPVGRFKIGSIAADRRPHLTNEVIGDPEVHDQEWARREGMVAFAGYPLVVGERALGVMAMFSRQPLSEAVLQALAAGADQIALGIERKQGEAARKEAERRLLESESQYRQLFDGNPHPMYVFDGETLGFLAVNEAMVRHYGYSRDEILGMTIDDLRPPEDAPALVRSLEEAEWAGAVTVRPGLFRHRRKDGTLVQMEISASRIDLRGWKAWLVLAMDITEKRSLEAQLAQAQKMESIGRLAGGVAHDFNNLLGVISGYGELLHDKVAADPRLAKYADGIVKAAHRAAGLTGQLLAFSRKQVLQPKILDLNSVVADLEKMLRRLIGEDLQLVAVFDDRLGMVKADPGQMEQVLMNLAVNARDAMPRGGRLTIETANADLDQAYVDAHPGVVPGRYVMLAVSDSGHGMSPEVQARVFEPFFTTKDVGKGTGLGLATVHGIVKQSGGHIWVYSEPGQGTVFKIYLPRADEPGRAAEAAAGPAETPRGSETVLVVEDELALRELVQECLEALGYVVLHARGGEEALEVCRRHSGPLHLLVTDVVMPHMSGRDLAANMQRSRPDVRVLYMSGYTDDAVVLHGVLSAEMAFIQKPFTAAGLARKVRDVLDEAR